MSPVDESSLFVVVARRLKIFRHTRTWSRFPRVHKVAKVLGIVIDDHVAKIVG